MNETWWVNPDQLDEEQTAIIDLPIDKHQMISGPPGSGKTNLLLLKGSQFVFDKRPNVLFLTFTRALKEFVASGSKNYEFDSENVRTINGWMMHFLRSEQVAFNLSGAREDFEEDRHTLIRLCREHVKRRKYRGIYNAIIVDEGQDCLPDEIQLFESLAETLLVATDDRQRIYSNASAVDAWHDVIPNHQRHYLTSHYRNGKKICQVADAITPVEDAFQMLPSSKYDEKRFPSVVRVKTADSLEEQVSAMIESLQREFRAYPDEDFGILCPSKVLNRVAALIRESAIADDVIYHINDGDGYSSFEDDKRVFLGSLHSGKGLEFRTLHLLGAEGFARRPNMRNLAYTAVTRAKTSLNVYHTAKLPALLTSAFAVVEERKPQAIAKQLFGKSTKDVE